MEARLTFNPPTPPAPLFVGREEELATLERLLCPRRGRPAPACVLTGPAGSGKTELALQFVSFRETEFSFRYWVSAHTMSPITALARARMRAGHGLLVIDDITDLDYLYEHLPGSGPLRVVLITRQPSPRGVPVLRLRGLARHCALRLLREADQPADEQEALRQVLDLVETLPVSVLLLVRLLSSGIYQPSDLLHEIECLGAPHWLERALSRDPFFDVASFGVAA